MTCFIELFVESLWRLRRSVHTANDADSINNTAPVKLGVPIPTRITTVERMNPVFLASCGKSMMCLYEKSRMIISETIRQVKKSEKKTVRLKLVSPSSTPIDHEVNEYKATRT